MFGAKAPAEATTEDNTTDLYSFIPIVLLVQLLGGFPFVPCHTGPPRIEAISCLSRKIFLSNASWNYPMKLQLDDSRL